MEIKEVKIGHMGFKIFLDPESKQNCQRNIYKHGRWEPRITKMVLRWLKPGNVFIDAGAAVGWFTLLAASIVGKHGKVIAFEPNPDRLRMLIKSVKLNGFTNVSCSEKALSDIDGDALIGGRADGEVLSREDSKGITIRTTALDTFLQSNGISKVDLIKIDIEGLELKALKGMRKTIRSNPHIKIICETHPKLLLKHGATKDKLLEYVSKTIKLRKQHIEGRHWFFGNG